MLMEVTHLSPNEIENIQIRQELRGFGNFDIYSMVKNDRVRYFMEFGKRPRPSRLKGLGKIREAFVFEASLFVGVLILLGVIM